MPCAGRRPRSRGDQLVLPLELDVGQLADLDRTQDPVAVDEVRLRSRHDAVGAANRAGWILDRRPCRAVLGDEVASRARRVDEEHADHGEAVAGVGSELLQQQRKLVAAGHAARIPEVDDDRSPAHRGEVEGRAVEGGAGHVRDGLALGEQRLLAGRRRAVRRRQGAGELHQGDGRDDGRREPEEHVSAPAVDLESRGATYLTVSVPVMEGTGWIEHWYPYVPGCRASYW